ncbi:MAG TPA: serine/threonine-protein kinase, partial [Kineosporiaceae bacterium]|nr:serine/threonine-protein kinase [Kineosporiaceae bacterium]
MPPPRVSDEWGPGGSIAGFEVVAELGRGAQSRVFRVRRPGGGADSPEYALKVLDCLPSGSGQALVAFRREAALLASVGHPGLTAIHEVSQVEGRAYLVMDLVEGVTLAELLAGRALLPERVISLARDVVGPLAAVHRRGLVHRDLKPNNIMILPGGQARLIDFGLATRESSDQGQSAVGTLMYSPPEQTGMLKRPVDNRSDLY